MELKHITRAEWVAALRSGKYRQAQGKLRHNDGFCCLGVACDLAGLDWTLISNIQRSSSTFVVRADDAPNDYMGKPYPLVDLFYDLGLGDGDTTTLATHNDRGDSFELIADEIEKLPVRVLDPDWLNRNFPYAAEANAEASRI